MPILTRKTASWLFGVLALLSAACAEPALAEQTGVLIGTLRSHVVAQGETLLDLARRYDLGFVELRAANPGVDPWVPPVGLELTLPTAHLLPEAPRGGLVINLAEQRVYYVPKSGPVVTHPVGTGKCGWETPIGETEIVDKRKNPSWIPPASIRAERPDLPAIVPPGPGNPLGEFALDLGWKGYVIHGTNRPHGVGRRVSHGCIRLYPEDIATLFHRVPVGTPVAVIDQPVKIRRVAGELYLEIHPTQAQADEVEAKGSFMAERIPELQWRIVQAAGADAPRLDWALIGRLARERRGVPVRITRPAGGLDSSERLFPGYLRSD